MLKFISLFKIETERLTLIFNLFSMSFEFLNEVFIINIHRNTFEIYIYVFLFMIQITLQFEGGFFA